MSVSDDMTGDFDDYDRRDGPVVGRTNWKKFGVVMVPALAAATATVIGIAEGAVAASFQVSGQAFTVSFDSFTGTGFQQYAGVDTGPGDKKYVVAPTGIHKMEARRMCQSVAVPVPFFDTVVLRLTAGSGDQPVTAKNLVVDTETLRGEAAFSNVDIGRDASTIEEVPGHKGPEGGFGQRADTVQINHLRQRARSATAGTFVLPDLGLKVGTHVPECE